MNSAIKTLLEQVKAGTVSVEDAMLRLKDQPYEDLGYAKVDLHRQVRQGAAEVIYGAGKTAGQISGILQALAENGQSNVLITRLDAEKAEEVNALFPITYYPAAGIGIAGTMAAPSGLGTIVVATGGTSDLPVAEEAALRQDLLLDALVFGPGREDRVRREVPPRLLHEDRDLAVPRLDAPVEPDPGAQRGHHRERAQDEP